MNIKTIFLFFISSLIQIFFAFFSKLYKKSAVFPLQLLGIDVDIINTVQFSNHTGYPNGWGGEVLKDEIFAKLRDGLQKNNLLPSITHVLQGYCPNIHLLDQIYQLILVFILISFLFVLNELILLFLSFRK